MRANIIEDSLDRNTFPKEIMQFMQHFFRPYRLYFVYMLLVVVLASLITTLHPYVLKKLLNTAARFMGESNFIIETSLPVGILIALYILENLLWRLNNYAHLKTLPALRADIVDETSSYIHHHSLKFFQDNLSGSLSNKISDLANNAESLILAITGKGLLMQLLTIFFAIIIASSASSLFSLLFLIWTLLFIKASFHFSKGIEPYAKKLAETRSHAMGNVVDSFVNAMNIILFAREDYEKKYLRESLNIMVEKDKDLHKILLRYAFVMSSMTVAVQILTIMLLLYLGAKGLLTVGDFVLIFMLSITILDQVWGFTQGAFTISSQLGVFKQALQTLAVDHDIIDSTQAIPLKVTEGNIVFSRVHFYYTETQQLFEDKTLLIQGGKKVGLVGYSGSGKSTFVNLITRTFDIQKGDILIDNQSISSVTMRSLRDNISFIPQDPTLFHRTLIDNICYGKLDATEDEIIEAAKKAHVHEFATELSEGYQTLVGERGVKLSGGQRQRIAIARAILKNAPILILDEATSALDSVTESLIQKSLYNAMQNKTVIVIAHRLSTVKAMDRILVFQQGHIVEEGTHEHLMEKGVIYQNLWTMQGGQPIIL